MNKNIKYTLEPYSGSKSRHECPNCKDKHSFSYYIDIETRESLSRIVGRCNHESSCGYHYKPSSYREDGIGMYTAWGDVRTLKYTPPTPAPISYFDKKYLIETESNHIKNNFMQFLLLIYDYESVMITFDKYRIGTSDYWDGATIFWYIDKRNRICSGKVMSYNQETGKRIKLNDKPLINSMRSILQKKGLIDTDFNQKTGLYGEHLLVNNDMKVHIVESEKTAILASIQFPQFIWLAAGGRSFLTKERLKAVKGRDVTLFPDNDAQELWKEIASKYRLKISTLIEKKHSDSKGDLADYILSFYKY